MEKETNETVLITPEESCGSYIATESRIAEKLNSLTEPDREFKVKKIVDVVKITWNKLKENGLLEKLEMLENAEREMNSCEIKPIEGVPNNRPKYYWWHINIEYGNANTVPPLSLCK